MLAGFGVKPLEDYFESNVVETRNRQPQVKLIWQSIKHLIKHIRWSKKLCGEYCIVVCLTLAYAVWFITHTNKSSGLIFKAFFVNYCHVESCARSCFRITLFRPKLQFRNNPVFMKALCVAKIRESWFWLLAESTAILRTTLQQNIVFPLFWKKHVCHRFQSMYAITAHFFSVQHFYNSTTLKLLNPDILMTWCIEKPWKYDSF